MNASRQDRELGVGLLCTLNGGTVALPVDLTGQVIELSPQPLPLARPVFRGVVFHGGQPILVLRLGSAPATPAATARGVLLEVPGVSWRCAMEVDAVVGLERIRRAAQRPGRPAWLVDGVSAGGRAVAWVELAAVLALALGRPALPPPQVAL